MRINQWSEKYPKLRQELGQDSAPYVAEQFSVVITNPPFGESLKVKAADCRASGYTISTSAAMKGPSDFVDLEIGLLYLEIAHRLLRIDGRVGINIPMEAFEEFCRAKTNFYIFQKIGYGRPEPSKESRLNAHASA